MSQYGQIGYKPPPVPKRQRILNGILSIEGVVDVTITKVRKQKLYYVNVQTRRSIPDMLSDAIKKILSRHREDPARYSIRVQTTMF